MKKHAITIAAMMLALTMAAVAQQPTGGGGGGTEAPAAIPQGQVMPVWEDATPNADQPTLAAYLPDKAKANGTAVIVCPGGAFRGLSMVDEGSTVAKSLNDHGIAAFVLKYHLLTGNAGGGGRGRGAPMGALPRNLEIKNANANPEPDNKELAEVVRLATLDGRQSIKLVRRRAAEWNINPNRIGIMGFSAGGGVAVGSVLEADAQSKPNFIATLYGPALVDVHVPADAPPLFIAVAADHQPVANGLLALYTVWKTAGKSAELHIYSNGRAGFGMRKQGLPSDTWIDRYYDWMKVQGFTQ